MVTSSARAGARPVWRVTLTDRSGGRGFSDLTNGDPSPTSSGRGFRLGVSKMPFLRREGFSPQNGKLGTLDRYRVSHYSELARPTPICAGPVISLLHPVRLRPTTLPQLSKGLAHSLVPNSLGRLLTSVGLAHFFISISLMYMLSVMTAPAPNPVANATRTMLNVSMSVSYSSGACSST